MPQAGVLQPTRCWRARGGRPENSQRGSDLRVSQPSPGAPSFGLGSGPKVQQAKDLADYQSTA